MKRQAQGYALITVLLSFMLTAALVTVTISLSTAEIGQSGNNLATARVRAAAEAAQADTLFYMTNQGLTDVNAVLDGYATAFAYSNGNASTTPVIPTSKYTEVLGLLNSKPGTKINSTVNGVPYNATIVYTGMNVDEQSFSASGQTYVVNYSATGKGSTASYTRTVTTRGQLQIRMGRQYLNQFVLLADDGGALDGNFYATGMDYDGPVHINQNWRFAGKPSFKYGATTAAATVQMSATCDPSKQQNVSSQSNVCTAPNWNGYGLKYAAQAISLPVNTQSQQKAALGLDASSATTLTNNQECVALGANFTTCGTTAVGNGVYIPYDSSNTITGGIYIKGNAKSIAMSVSGNIQNYSIVDANNKTVNIAVNYTTQTTSITKNGSTKVLNGVLSGDPQATGKANGMIYSTGSVLSLGGPTRVGTLANPVPDVPNATNVPPAVASKSVINVAAAQDIVVSKDLTYQDDPRVNATAKNVLGLMSGSGSVRISSTAPNDIYVHAALLAGANNQGFKVDSYNTGVKKGQIHLLGSVAEDADPPRGVGALSNNGITITSGYGDAFNFDPRFLNGGAVPPYYPATKKFTAQAVWPNQQGWQEE